jgi:Family of unknown function (DUF6088)
VRKRQMTLREQVAARIARRRDDAFLTREFLDLGGERQVLRALRELTDEGKLIRLGYGVYGRAEISPITQQPMLAGEGFNAVARRALDKLNVRWEPPSAEVDYNEGRSTQVPMNPRVRLRGDRFSRKLRYKTMELTFER